MSQNEGFSSCELPVRGEQSSDNRNRLYAFQDDFTWTGVRSEKYKTGGDDWSGIARQILIGGRGESVDFHLRYFEIEPGGFSSYETHEHEHVVIGIRGRGKVRLKGRVKEISMLDVLYINPCSEHRLFNPYKEPFGFFCVVSAERDRPRPVKDNSGCVQKYKE